MMFKLTYKICYGTFHQHDDVLHPSVWPMLSWLAVLAGFIIIRLRLPFVDTDPLEVHGAIVESLVHGRTWGRQALVGSLEFPLLTSLALFAARAGAGWFRLPAGYVLVVLAQAWVFYYLLRLPGNRRGAVFTGLLILAAGWLSPEARRLFFRVDPNWAIAVPAVAGMYHLVRWSRSRSLRDLVLTGVNGGILACAGPAGLAAALVMLLIVSYGNARTAQKHCLPTAAKAGFNLLAWAPLVYFLALFFVVNWLIMENPLFFLRRLYDNLLMFAGAGLRAAAWSAVKDVAWLITGGFIMSLLTWSDPDNRYYGAAVALVMVAIFWLQLVMNNINYYLAGGEIMLLLLALTGLQTVLQDFPRQSAAEAGHSLWRGCGRVVILTVCLFLSAAAANRGLHSIDVYAPPPPARAEVLQEIDRYTPDARVMVHGLQAPARFLDLEEQRFVARLDFDLETLNSLIRDEDYFYLLVAPDNGRFYSPRNPLSDLHRHGRPWLVLQKNWPGGWQLWLVLRTPGP